MIRNAGNIVPAYSPGPGGVSATVEYAVAVLGVTDIIICGHSGCGAMTAISNDTSLVHLPAIASWLAHADAAKAVNAARTYGSAQERLEAVVRGNVIAQLTNIRTHPSVALALDKESAEAPRLGLRHRNRLHRHPGRRHGPLCPLADNPQANAMPATSGLPA